MTEEESVMYHQLMKIFVHNFTLKITSARAWITARLNKGPVVSLVEKNMGPGNKTSKYGIWKLRLQGKFPYSWQWGLRKCREVLTVFFGKIITNQHRGVVAELKLATARVKCFFNVLN